MWEVGCLTAFLGGLLALLSPCSALLLPAFFAYAFAAPGLLLRRTAAFYGGLCLTLVPLGVAGSYAGRLFVGHREALVAAGGWTMVALGLAQAAGLGFGSRRAGAVAARLGPALTARPAAPAAQPPDDQPTAPSPGAVPSPVPAPSPLPAAVAPYASVTALGAVYGLAGFCAGPILGGILTVSALGGAPVYGGLLLAVYALGMAVPLLCLALVWKRWELGRRRWLRGRPVRIGRFRAHSTSLVSGAFFVLIGVVFLRSGGTSALPGLLDADRQAGLEQWAWSAGGAVSDARLLPLAAAGLAALAVFAVRAARRGGRDVRTARRGQC
ncbi:cytochrome c biogenesis CcdA family protein [Streptomyces sp. TRM 70351]|uniref:cytochrome c biogenesis CcdA family protein n=1 Tax=Streptomyces sp. TRM 70351 TaxID=3116552 RepID=UPI003FCDF08C